MASSRSAKGSGSKGSGPKGSGAKDGARGAAKHAPKGQTRGGRSEARSRRQPTAPRPHRPRPHTTSQKAQLTGDVVYGRRSVAEALEAELPVRQAFVAEAAHGRDANLARLIARLEGQGIEVKSVSKATLDGLAYGANHQGILLEIAPFSYAELGDVIAKAGEGDALVVLLDHVQDEGNLGAIARSAECVGASGLVIANRRAAGAGPGAYKASAGALAHLPIAQVPNLASAIDELKRAGFWVVCATEHAEASIWESDLSGRICLVMGNEDKGVSRLVQEHADLSVALPIVGRIESLNVAQAATVFCYEWLRHTLGELGELPVTEA